MIIVNIRQSVMVTWPNGSEKPYSIGSGSSTMSQLRHALNKPNDDIYDIISALFKILHEIFPVSTELQSMRMAKISSQIADLMVAIMTGFINTSLPKWFAGSNYSECRFLYFKLGVCFTATIAGYDRAAFVHIQSRRTVDATYSHRTD